MGDQRRRQRCLAAARIAGQQQNATALRHRRGMHREAVVRTRQDGLNQMGLERGRDAGELADPQDGHAVLEHGITRGRRPDVDADERPVRRRRQMREERQHTLRNLRLGTT